VNTLLRALRASRPAALLAAAFCLFASAVSAQAQAQRPNVLLVIADDLGVDSVGAYGEHPDPPPTPTLDALAQQGVLFRNAWSAPVCGPARAALLTGRHAFRTGFGQGSDFLTDPWEVALGERTLPELIAPVVRTAAVGKWHMASAHVSGTAHPRLSGFARFRGSMKELGGFTGDGYSAWTRVVDGVAAPCTQYATSREVDDALELVAAFGDAPWFLWLAFNAPHSPYHAPPAALHSQALPPDPGASIPQHYRAMVQAMDTELGRLLSAMDPVVRARTIVVFVGDNGTPPEATTAPFLPGHAKGTVYEGGVNVPLIVAGPGVVGGAECAALVSTTDLYATIAELLGSPPSAAEDSVSLAPYLAQPGHAALRATVYTESFMPNGPPPHVQRLRAVRDARYKLVHVHKKSTLPNERHFYDLLADPFEQHDLLDGPHGSPGAPLCPGAGPDAQAALAALSALLAEPAVPWQAVGPGLAGAWGAPALSGSGPLLPGTPFTLALAGASPKAPSTLVMGLANIGVWFAGGILVPRPDASVPLVADAQGGLVVGGALPPFLPPGASLVFQYWIVDPSGPAGWSASNGLAANVY
jgi:arylsulfatase A-like enzyme